MNFRSWVIINKHEIDESLSLGLIQNDMKSLMALYMHVYLHYIGTQYVYSTINGTH